MRAKVPGLFLTRSSLPLNLQPDNLVTQNAPAQVTQTGLAVGKESSGLT